MILHARLSLLAALAFLLSCAVEVGPPHEELAPDYQSPGDQPAYPARPLPRRNVAPPEPPPNSSTVKVSGYWAATAWGWIWVPAREVPLPRPGSVRVVDRFCRPWAISN